jgi:hypothetical protein
MSLVGYPDFQEQAQWQSPPAVVYNQVIANGATKSFPAAAPAVYNVSNWSATQMRIFAQFSALDVEVQWYDADPPTALLSHQYFTTSDNGSDTTVTLPNGGPYLRVNVTNLSGFAPTLVAIIAFTNRVVPPFACPSSGPLLYGENLTAVPGIIKAVDASYLYAGPATAWFFTDATAWSCEFGSISSAGTFQYHQGWDSNGAGGARHFRTSMMVPPRSMRYRFLNNDAANKQLYVSLIPDMFR